nr:immunoglobulin heavy chain junction region [Macaca mulatta]MOW20703.1 immunoglobulin heavy chain junction region [Macaca mulatta]MOY21024.1 immunoglobulin heavy chain junction region [Macaca mulatta]MOY21088.1 immunoglobulin heavy chain junction region [Macaca mulatta]MOY21137.1 immunoglobulin heavy chain junction region [Macaca mulatta]
CARWQSVFDYW